MSGLRKDTACFRKRELPYLKQLCRDCSWADKRTYLLESFLCSRILVHIWVKFSGLLPTALCNTLIPVMLCAASIQSTFMHQTAISTHHDLRHLAHAAVSIDMDWKSADIRQYL